MSCNIWYIDIIDHILKYGVEKNTRNGKTKRITNVMKTFDSTPLITVRKTAWKNALHEMEWFLSGSYNINQLNSSVQSWWKPWATKDGWIENHYGRILRWWKYYNKPFDSIKYLVDEIKKDSRRAVITTWNTPAMADEDTPIATCHGTVIQCFVDGNKLNMTMYQRSADFIVGVPHNLIQYYAFLMWLAYKTDKEIGSFTWIGGDVHIYEDHFALAKEIRSKITDIWDMQEMYQLTYKSTDKEFKANDFTFDKNPLFLINKSAKLIV